MANRTIREQRVYTREEIESVVKNYAMLEIVGPMYVGDFKDQVATWQPDGSLLVVTSHAPGDMADWRALKAA